MGNESYEFIANSPLMLGVCAAALAVVTVFAVIFLSKAVKEAGQVGLTRRDVKELASTAAVSCVLPAVSTILFLILLTPMLGRFFSWFRLSVLGSGTYEAFAADAAAKAMGYISMPDPSVTKDSFVTIMWTMSLGISSALFTNLLVFPSYYKGLQRLTTRKEGFGRHAGNSLMMAMMVVLLLPRAMDFHNPIGMLTTIFSAAVVLLFNYLGRTPRWHLLKDYAFSLSMLLGVTFAAVAGNTFLK